MRWICRWLWIPEDVDRWPGEWFMQLQGLMVSAVTLLNVWIVLDFSFRGFGEKYCPIRFGRPFSRRNRRTDGFRRGYRHGLASQIHVAHTVAIFCVYCGHVVP